MIFHLINNKFNKTQFELSILLSCTLFRLLMKQEIQIFLDICSCIKWHFFLIISTTKSIRNVYQHSNTRELFPTRLSQQSEVFSQVGFKGNRSHDGFCSFSKCDKQRNSPYLCHEANSYQ